MIRFAQQSDTERIRALWEVCFPDEGGFNPWYFEYLYRPEHTLIYELDGELAAMLQMLPFEIEADGTAKSVTYIYGACTAPQHRRKHLMSQLLEESFRLDRENGRAASVLIPQEDWLFGFYRKFGYQAGFTVSTRKYQCKSPENAVKAYRLTDADICDLEHLYQQISVPKVVRPNRFWEIQLKLFQTIGAGAFGIRQDGCLKAAAFCWTTEQGIWIQEMLAATPEDGQLLADLIGRQSGSESVTITSVGNEIPLGCVKFYDTEWENGYMNLMFN